LCNYVQSGYTPPHYAAFDADTASAAALLTHNREMVHALDNFYHTSLHVASLHGKETMVSLLLTNGADVDARGEVIAFK